MFYRYTYACILVNIQQGATLLVEKEKFILYRSLGENGLISNLIYYLIKHFPDEFMVSISCFKSSSIRHDVNLVNIVHI